MLNLNRTNRNALISIFTLIAVIFVIGMLKQSSKYQPKPIVIKSSNEESLFDLPDDIACAPVVPKSSSLSKRVTRLRMESVDL